MAGQPGRSGGARPHTGLRRRITLSHEAATLVKRRMLALDQDDADAYVSGVVTGLADPRVVTLVLTQSPAPLLAWLEQARAAAPTDLADVAQLIAALWSAASRNRE